MEIVNDTATHTPPAESKPAYLDRVYDPTFGSMRIRITDSGNSISNPTSDPSLTGKSWGTRCGHRYSSHSAWNADESLIFINRGVTNPVFLHGTTYEPQFMVAVPGDGAYWHPTDKDIMFVVDRSAFQLIGWNPVTDTNTWTKTFTGWDNLDWGKAGTSVPSDDGDIVALVGQKTSDSKWYAIVYKRSTDSIVREIDLDADFPFGGENPWGGPECAISADGTVVRGDGCTGSSVCERSVWWSVATGSELWRETTYRHNPGHDAYWTDQNGDDYVVGLSKAGTNANDVIKRLLSDGTETLLHDAYCSHTSMNHINSARDVAFGTKHSGTVPTYYDSEAIGYFLDGTSNAERYCHMHTVNSNYDAEAHVSSDRRGFRFLFRSNWDVSAGNVDCYAVHIGAAPPARSLIHRMRAG